MLLPLSLISILTGVSTTAATEFLQEILFPGEPVLPHSKKREESSCSFVSRMTCESEGHSRGALVRGISGTGARSLTLSRRHTQRLICRAKEEGEKGGCFLRRLLLPPPALVLVHHLSCQSLPVPHSPVPLFVVRDPSDTLLWQQHAHTDLHTGRTDTGCQTQNGSLLAFLPLTPSSVASRTPVSRLASS